MTTQTRPGVVIATNGNFRIRDTSPGAMYPWTVDQWYPDADPEPVWLPTARFTVKNDALKFLAMKAEE